MGPVATGVLTIDVKNVFLLFYFGHVFYFPKVLFLKNIGKVQSGKQIN